MFAIYKNFYKNSNLIDASRFSRCSLKKLILIHIKNSICKVFSHFLIYLYKLQLIKKIPTKWRISINTYLIQFFLLKYKKIMQVERTLHFAENTYKLIKYA